MSTLTTLEGDEEFSGFGFDETGKFIAELNGETIETGLKINPESGNLIFDDPLFGERDFINETDFDFILNGDFFEDEDGNKIFRVLTDELSGDLDDSRIFIPSGSNQIFLEGEDSEGKYYYELSGEILADDELGRFGLKMPKIGFKFKAPKLKLRAPKFKFKAPKFKALKFNAKGLSKGVSGLSKGLSKGVSGLSKGLSKGVSGLSKGLSKGVSGISKGISNYQKELSKGISNIAKGAGGLVSSLAQGAGSLLSPGGGGGESEESEEEDPQESEDPQADETEDPEIMSRMSSQQIEDEIEEDSPGIMDRITDWFSSDDEKEIATNEMDQEINDSELQGSELGSFTAIGSLVGSVIPGAGTAAGGMIGSLLDTGMGASAKNKANRKAKQQANINNILSLINKKPLPVKPKARPIKTRPVQTRPVQTITRKPVQNLSRFASISPTSENYNPPATIQQPTTNTANNKNLMYIGIAAGVGVLVLGTTIVLVSSKSKRK